MSEPAAQQPGRLTGDSLSQGRRTGPLAPTTCGPQRRITQGSDLAHRQEPTDVNPAHKAGYDWGLWDFEDANGTTPPPRTRRMTDPGHSGGVRVLVSGKFQ